MIDHELTLSDTLRDIKPSGIRKFFDLLNEIEGVISLTVGQPDFITPWHIREAGVRSIEQGKTYYTSNAGLSELRDELASYLYRRFSLSYIPQKEIIVNNCDYSDYVGFLGGEDPAMPDEFYAEALGIIIDTATSDRVSNPRYALCKEICKIDHHIPKESYGDYEWVEEHRSSSCEMIAGKSPSTYS